MNAASLQDELVRQIEAAGVTDRRVLDSLRATPREQFVPEVPLQEAYLNTALPIACGQTISQPYIVATMTEALQLKGSERVLEIGTGSGYQAAILSQLCGRVFTVERYADLSRSARRLLEHLGYTNIEYHVADGTLGWPEHAPYDGIVVTAAAPAIPDPLVEQLAEGGRMVIPVGTSTSQELLVVRKSGGELEERKLCNCRFVKLVGEAGWDE